MSLGDLLQFPYNPNGILLALVFFGVFTVILAPLHLFAIYFMDETPSWFAVFLIPAFIVALFVMLKVNEWLDYHAW